MRVSEIASQIRVRISAAAIKAEDYVSTDNMRSNFGGIDTSSSLPPSGSVTAYQEGDILLSNIRPYFRKTWLATHSGGCNADVLCIRANPNKCFSKYLYYLFTTDNFVNDYLKSCKGAKMPRGDVQRLLNYEVDLPDLPTQLRIAGVLGSLDEKIALNRTKIAELEALAKTIYDYWFVQFDFPDKNGNPYKSSGGKMVWNEQLKCEVPEGWEVTQIGKHIKSNRGVSYSTKNISSGEGIPMINLNSFNVTSTYKVAGIKTFEGEIPDYKLLKPFDLVMCNTQQTDLDPNKDIIGKSFLVPDIFNSNITSSHHVTTIHVDDNELKVFLNALFHTKEFHAYISGFASGTSIRGLDFFGVESCHVALPPKPLLSKFSQLVMACEKQKSIVLRNQSLLQPLRDYLLPLLMNGQVTVGGLK